MKNSEALDVNEIVELIFTHLAEVSSSGGYDDTMFVLANMGKSLSSADRCSIWLVSDDKKSIWTKVAHGMDAIELPIDSGIVGSAVTDGKKIIIDDVYKDKRFNQKVDIQTGYLTKSMMVIPMVNNSNEIIGAIQVINKQNEQGVFDERDLERLSLTSIYAAETLVAAKLLKDERVEVHSTKEENPHQLEILGAYGTKSKGFGTTSFSLNEKNVIDAGNLLDSLEESSIEIDNIWLTHSHLDHISDIAYILDNYFALRTKTLNVIALPETIQAIKENFLNDSIWPDFSVIPMYNSKKMVLKYTEIELGREYEIGSGESIKAFETDHNVASCGYIYKKDEKAVLITADTYSLDSMIYEIEKDESITTAVVECSFPSSMKKLAIESKHLTPELLFSKLEKLKRDDIKLYINHIKPTFLNKIIDEIEELRGKWEPIILKDGDFINFS